MRTMYLLSLLAEKITCAIKDPNKLIWHHPWLNRNDCHKLVKITKYLHRFLVCYKIEKIEINSEELDFEDVTFSPSYPGAIIKYFLNESLVSQRTFSIYIHSKFSSNLYDSVFAIENQIDFHETKELIAMFTPVTHRRLPPPFDTMCVHFPGSLTGGEYLFRKLNNVTMEQLNHVNTLGHVYKQYNLPMITTYSLRNATFHDMFMDLKRKIFKKPVNGCNFVYNVPQTMRQEGERISLILNWPQDSGIEVDSVPNQESIDFLIYTLSSIGTWFGLSIFSILSSLERKVVYGITQGEEGANYSKDEPTNCIIIRDCGHSFTVAGVSNEESDQQFQKDSFADRK